MKYAENDKVLLYNEGRVGTIKKVIYEMVNSEETDNVYCYEVDIVGISNGPTVVYPDEIQSLIRIIDDDKIHVTVTEDYITNYGNEAVKMQKGSKFWDHASNIFIHNGTEMILAHDEVFGHIIGFLPLNKTDFVDKKDVIQNNGKCYARGCDSYNVDGTCMHGDVTKAPCQVNCYKCVHLCKKKKGDIACSSFERLEDVHRE